MAEEQRSVFVIRDLDGNVLHMLEVHSPGCLSWAVLEDLDLRRASLAGVTMEAVMADSADFRQASLVGADMWGAFCPEAKFDGADLRDADLRTACLCGASLRGADLRGANLEGAKLEGADLTDTRVEEALFEGACYDEQTLLPQGFDPSAHGMRRRKQGIAGHGGLLIVRGKDSAAPVSLRLRTLECIIIEAEVDRPAARDSEAHERIGLRISGIFLPDGAIVGRCTARKGSRLEFESVVGQKLIVDFLAGVHFALVRETPEGWVKLEDWILTAEQIQGANVVHLRGLDGGVLHLRLERTGDTKD